MNRGVRNDIKAKKGSQINDQNNKNLLKRSKSKSRSRSPQRSIKKIGQKDQKNNKKLNKGGKDNRNRDRSPSLARSRSKSPIQKSASSKKIKRLVSQPKISNVKSTNKLNKSSSLKNSRRVVRSPQSSARKIPQNPSKKIAIINKEQRKQPLGAGKKPQPTIRQQQKDMGLVLNFPQHEKVLIKQIDTLDQAYEKFLEMVCNDNDASYVMNALPEFRDLKKQDDTQGRDFISGRITRLSGVFDNLNVDKISAPLRKVPNYYTGPCGKNLILCKLCLMTKFKIQVDLGFIQYSLDGDKITIFRIYLSKIYRKMNYVAFVYLEVLKMLLDKHPAADRWSIFILERNMSIHKFFKYMGLKIEKIITDSKNKHQVDYYQEFSTKKKDLQTAISVFK